MLRAVITLHWRAGERDLGRFPLLLFRIPFTARGVDATSDASPRYIKMATFLHRSGKVSDRVRPQGQAHQSQRAKITCHDVVVINFHHKFPSPAGEFNLCKRDEQ